MAAGRRASRTVMLHNSGLLHSSCGAWRYSARLSRMPTPHSGRLAHGRLILHGQPTLQLHSGAA